jgi:F-type H+-transporting ATPase subunit c
MMTILLLASPTMFAQAPAAPPPTSQWVLVAAALAMAIASGLCGLAQSKAVVGASEGMARNPAAAPMIRFALFLGLVLIESLALYTFVVGFVVIFR